MRNTTFPSHNYPFCRAVHAIKEGYIIPLLVVVDDLNPMELIDVMCDWGAVNVIQRPAIIDKQFVEMVDRYASSYNIILILDNALLSRKITDYRGIVEPIYFFALRLKELLFCSAASELHSRKNFSLTSLRVNHCSR